jgi:RNA polymerase sigma-70 factor, ECF subfamily
MRIDPVQQGWRGKGRFAGEEPEAPESQPATESRRREFEATALPHLDALYNMALRITREPSAAEDLVQETCIRAYRFFSRYQRGTNCKAWLFKILKNTSINRFRKTRSQPDAVDFAAIEEHSESCIRLETADRSPEAMVADARLGTDVRAALTQLPEEFRMVVVLSIVEGHTYKEVAEIMDCPIGTVMSRLFRARKILQEALQAHARERGLLRERDGGTERRGPAPAAPRPRTLGPR